MIRGDDPEVFFIQRGAVVWVARRDPTYHGASWQGYRLHEHVMKEDMLFRGYDRTIMNPDPSLPRIAVGPLSPKGETLYYGKPLLFCTFVDHGQNAVGRKIVELGLDPCEFTAEELQAEGYNTYWTGNPEWPFIICNEHDDAVGVKEKLLDDAKAYFDALASDE